VVEAGAGRVYIVDDDDFVRDSLRTLLELYDVEVLDFPSCAAFAAAYDGTGGGCLVLDQHMPGMTGVEFMESRGAALRGLPVVMVSGRTDPVTIDRARRAGVAEFLEKPFDSDRLVDTVLRLMATPAAA